MDWFFDLDIFSKIYWLIALIGSLVFVFIMITSFMGMDGADDLDVDGDIDADGGIGFQFITFKNLVGFFTIFGWSGIACLEAGFSKPLTIVISIFCGLVMMAIMAAMFYYMTKLNDSGTLNYKNALWEIGEVYLTVGANRSSMGKVSVRVQGTLRELEALSDSPIPLKSGTVVQVVDLTSNGILIVETPQKPIEPSKTKTYAITSKSG